MTVREISVLTQLSPATVYRAFKDPSTVSLSVRKKIEALTGDLKKNPDKIRHVYVVLPHINAFYTAYLMEIIRLLAREKIQVIPFISEEDPEKEREFISQIHFSSRIGFVWNPASQTSDFPFLHRKKNKPAIVMVSRSLINYVPDLSIALANRDAARKAVETLINGGNRSILMINGPDSIQTAKERSEGFLDCLSSVSEVRGDIITASYRDWRETYRILSHMKKDIRHYDAVIAASEVITYGALKILTEEGLVIPRDIRFLAFDNSPTFEALSLSTIYFSPENMAQKTVEFLIKKKQNENFSIRDNFMPHLTLLGSEKKQS